MTAENPIESLKQVPRETLDFLFCCVSLIFEQSLYVATRNAEQVGGAVPLLIMSSDREASVSMAAGMLRRPALLMVWA